MKKTIVFGIVALILLALVTGCSNNSSDDSNADAPPANNTPGSDAPTPAPDISGNGKDNNTKENLSLIVYGNTSGNITNGAFVAQDGNIIYYVLTTHPGYEMLMGDLIKTDVDGSIETILYSGGRPHGLNIVDGWIYFIADGLIYKVREDGTKNTLITSGYSGNNFLQGYTTQEFYSIYRMVVVDNWIYCRAFNFDRTNGIFRINADNGEVEKLQQIDGAINGFAVYDGWIYFSKSEGDSWGAYRVRTDGTENEKIADFLIYLPNILNDKIYYLGGEDALQIYRMDLDGTNSERIAGGVAAASINVVDDWIYYATGRAVYKMSTEGTESIKLCDFPNSSSVELNVLDDWVYLIEGRESGTGNRHIMHRVSTNGGELQAVNILFEDMK